MSQKEVLAVDDEGVDAAAFVFVQAQVVEVGDSHDLCVLRAREHGLVRTQVFERDDTRWCRV
ncbi:MULTISPECIES: hypothetical protein [unclassified Rhodococcus (in: high G+C Gram-positive bacteria)]|uniref:hypothetical protein n=1 Tax=unclassified Rhodococcus (in: high G+C Gram-positive bacteria) TaxID=192944 RepID=UPI00163A217D|nr:MULTISPECIES: hypothetical protein [unclassified Rhodococcus (in: high G+C Gram-positive bacteria)]MBC2639672.1 hypothetical protein [Rhodococcus sp. 3A]MBC2895583.1 hypothetical protein [Rhodococcus sp. 4CII]